MWNYRNFWKSVKNGSKKTSADVTNMAQSIAHRGPDGTFIKSSSDFNACFGMNTLSIIDKNGEKGPYQSTDGKLTLTYNGEIYNYKELAKKWGVDLNVGTIDTHG